ERTPSPGFQLYFPAMTRARPANLSDSVPASLDRAACVVCVVCARSGARLSTTAIATAHAIVLVRIDLTDTSCSHPTLYDGEPTIPQLHNDHNDIDRQARFCYPVREEEFTCSMIYAPS